jgi:hypothetical protein
MKSIAEQLRPIANRNAQFMREQAAKARQKRDFRYAGRIDVQARKWSEITVQGPTTRG